MADFSESKEFTIPNRFSSITVPKGTPMYMSPEMKRIYTSASTDLGQLGELDYFKSDVFSLGLVIYEVATLKDVMGLNENEGKLN